jgi:hypothetical protein
VLFRAVQGSPALGSLHSPLLLLADAHDLGRLQDQHLPPPVVRLRVAHFQQVATAGDLRLANQALDTRDPSHLQRQLGLEATHALVLVPDPRPQWALHFEAALDVGSKMLHLQAHPLHQKNVTQVRDEDFAGLLQALALRLRTRPLCNVLSAGVHRVFFQLTTAPLFRQRTR